MKYILLSMVMVCGGVEAQIYTKDLHSPTCNVVHSDSEYCFTHKPKFLTLTNVPDATIRKLAKDGSLCRAIEHLWAYNYVPLEFTNGDISSFYRTEPKRLSTRRKCQICQRVETKEENWR